MTGIEETFPQLTVKGVGYVIIILAFLFDLCTCIGVVCLCVCVCVCVYLHTHAQMSTFLSNICLMVHNWLLVFIRSNFASTVLKWYTQEVAIWYSSCFLLNWIRFDRTLGGKIFQSRLADHLAKEFTKMKKTSSSVYENPRALQKLHKEAGRLKNVLSANTEHFAQVFCPDKVTGI